MNNRILELAKECGCPSMMLVPGTELVYPTADALKKFYQLAHQDGQREMRERAVKVVEQLPSMIDGTVWPESCAGVIRNLEITNG